MTNAAGQKTAPGGKTPAQINAEYGIDEEALEQEQEENASALDVLLSATAIKQQEKWKIPKRDGLPGDLVLTLASLTDREFRDISAEAEEPIRASNRRQRRAGEATKEINPEKFLRLIVARGVVDPAFDHPQLLQKHQVMTAEQVVQRVLLPGEVAKVAELIMDLSGFNDATLELVGN
jgi:hypothetical protein